MDFYKWKFCPREQNASLPILIVSLTWSFRCSPFAELFLISLEGSHIIASWVATGSFDIKDQLTRPLQYFLFFCEDSCIGICCYNRFWKNCFKKNDPPSGHDRSVLVSLFSLCFWKIQFFFPETLFCFMKIYHWQPKIGLSVTLVTEDLHWLT